MPGATPIYGLPYPTVNDPVDPATFCALADAIDSLMAGTDALVDARTAQRSTRLDPNPTQSITVNVETILSWQAAFPALDTAPAMFSSGSPTILTVQVAGVYLINVVAQANGGAPVDTGTRVSCFQNGIRRFSEKRRGTNVASDLPEISVVGMLPCLVGDTLDVRLHWTGAGGPTTNVFAGLFQATYVCPVF